MTRTEYVNQLRDAGFIVRPAFQGRTGENTSPHKDLTCYVVYTAEGVLVTRMIVRDIEPGTSGLDVFFESPNVRVSGDIEHLRRMAYPGRAA